MDNRSIPLVLGLAITLATSGISAAARAADIIIGTGISARIHYSVGRAMCRQIQRETQTLTCEVLRIEGRHAAEPLAVLSNVRNGAIEVGLVQSDWQYHAFQGTGPLKFIDIKFDNLRSLFSLHAEPFTVIARRDSGIKSLDDLAGKRVNIGNPGSKQRVVMEMVMKAKGWTRESFQLVDELTEAEQSLALCHNRVQAIVSTVSHPDPAIAKAIELCDAAVVEVSGAAIDGLIADNRFLVATEVPAGVYKQDKAVKTFGVIVTAVSSADAAEDTTYAIVKSVFDNLQNLKRLHSALGNLLPGRMMTDGLSAPTHPGAARYFREKGMM
ncbi:MAG: TAXI family TRAP transporter solute-binding subunit [Acidiferrobacterales bacterium]